jgi:hypothetical protein
MGIPRGFLLPLYLVCISATAQAPDTARSSVQGNWHLFPQMQGSFWPQSNSDLPYVDLAIHVEGSAIYALGEFVVSCGRASSL